MTEKRFVLVKCVEHYWGIVDKSLESIDQLVLMHMNKTSVSYIVNVLNQLNDENEQLKETIKELELENAKHIGDGEWDIRDITYLHGKFRLEEWGQRYHQFYDGDKQLEDEEVVSLLFENEQLKKEKQGILKRIDDYIWEWEDEGTPVADEMKQLKKDIEKGYSEW